MLLKALRAWNRYKYRFVPWVAQNINENSPRVIVPHVTKTDELSHAEITRSLQTLFRQFVVGDKIRPYSTSNTDYLFNMGVCEEVLGFTINKEPSQLEDGGEGVFVSTGRVKKGSLVALYPGTVYQPWEPVLLISVANAYLFRCADGVHIDGCSKGLSKSLYISCARRDRQMGEYTCDISWLDDVPLNPLNVGQYINNQTQEMPANVAYQEYDVPADFPWEFRRFLPNIEARTMQDRSLEDHTTNRLLRAVVLVALRDIEAGEELLSSYYTLVYGEEEEEVEEQEQVEGRQAQLEQNARLSQSDRTQHKKREEESRKRIKEFLEN